MTITLNNKSEVFSLAWKNVKNLKIKISTALRMAWAVYKSERLAIARIASAKNKNISKNDQELINKFWDSFKACKSDKNDYYDALKKRQYSMMDTYTSSLARNSNDCLFYAKEILKAGIDMGKFADFVKDVATKHNQMKCFFIK